MRPVGFWDVDGVLNSCGGTAETAQQLLAVRACPEFGSPALCPILIERMARVVLATKSIVILSSTWRDPYWREDPRSYESILRYVLAQHGVKVHGRTHRGSGEIRGEEIAEWLRQFPTSRYFIVDDDQDMLPEQRANFIHVDHLVGISEQNLLEIHEIVDR